MDRWINRYLFFSCLRSIQIYESVKVISFCTEGKTHGHIHSAVHKLIMHGAHLVHMQLLADI